MPKNKSFILLLIILSTAFFINFPITPVGMKMVAEASLSNEPAATNMLGQLTDAGALDYSQNGVNSGPGRYGFAEVTYTALDTNNGRLFVSDYTNNRILVFNLVGNVLTDYQADYVLGKETFTTSTCMEVLANQSCMVFPQGLAYDSTGDRLFVSDSFNNRVLVYDFSQGGDYALQNPAPSGGIKAYYVLGQSSWTARDAATTQTGMNTPKGLNYDSTNHYLYVADSANNRVTVFDVASITSNEPAINVLGQENFTSSTTATTRDGLYTPSGVYYDANEDYLFVADYYNSRVMVWDFDAAGDCGILANGSDACFVLGQEDFVSSATATTRDGLNKPSDVNFDYTSDRLFVADNINGRVMVWDFDAAGDCGILANGSDACFVLGQADFTSIDTSNAAINSLSAPTGVSYNSVTDHVYASDGRSRVMVFDNDSMSSYDDAINVIGQLDNGGAINYNKGGLNNGPNNKGLENPEGNVVLDTVNHRLFVPDKDNKRVLIFNLNSSNVLVDYLADNVLGQTDLISSSQNYTQSTFRGVSGLAFDSVNNRLFVADNENSRIMVFNLNGGITDGMSATYVLGQANFTSGDANRGGSAARNSLNTPKGLHYDATNDQLFVADNGNNRVLVWDFDAGGDCGALATGSDACYVFGQANFTGGSYATTRTGLYGPVGVAYDTTESRLFVGDTTNNRAMVWDFDDGGDCGTLLNGSNACYVLGQADFTSGSTNRGGSAGQNTLNAPEGVSFDSSSTRIFVADTGNHRVLSYDFSSSISTGMNAANVIGLSIFTESSSSTSQTALQGPKAVFYNTSTKKLYVTDSSNRRVMIFDASADRPTTTTPTASQAADGTVSISFDVNDADDTGIQAKIEHSTDGGSTWSVSYLSAMTASTGTPSLVNNSSTSGYTITRHPFSYNGTDYDNNDEAVSGYIYLLPTNTPHDKTDLIDIETNDSDITEYIEDPQQAFHLGLVSLAGAIPATLYWNDSAYANQAAAQTWLDIITPGSTIDCWKDDAFSWDGSAYVFSAPTCSPTPTVMTDYQSGTPAIDYGESLTTVNYQIGSTTGIDVSGGANTITATWNPTSSLNENGAISTESSTLIRVTPYDGSLAGTVGSSASFTVDALSPSGLTALVASSQTTTTATLTWTAPTETNFDHYEIWYGTNQSDVQGRTGTAVEWDDSDDVALATLSTATTTITGLSAETQYYFKIWAIDDYTNLGTVDDISAETPAETPAGGGILLVTGISNSRTSQSTTSPSATTTSTPQSATTVAADTVVADTESPAPTTTTEQFKQIFKNVTNTSIEEYKVKKVFNTEVPKEIRYDLVNVTIEEANIVNSSVGIDETDGTIDLDQAGNIFKNGFEESVNRATGSGKTEMEMHIMTNGVKEVIKVKNSDEITLIWGMRKNAKDLKKEVEEAKKKGKRVIVVDENTDMDNDNVADVYQIKNDIPTFTPDPDFDGYSTNDE
ncbi:MAG: NHL repeat-containing protein, partial [Candidatus Gracilibacteria bacterium]